MKKLLFAIGVLTLAVTASAQSFASRSFFAPGVTAITITNASAAPLGGYTNLNSWGYFSPLTNVLGLTWTNGSGLWVIPTNNTPGSVTGISFVTNDSTPLTIDVPLYARRDGSLGTTVVSNSIPGGSLISDYSLVIRVVGGASATTTACPFIFVPVCDGVNESTTASDAWTVGITPNGTTPVVVVTNVPIWKWPGCKALRLKSANNAISSAAAIGVTIQSISLNGFVP